MRWAVLALALLGCAGNTPEPCSQESLNTIVETCELSLVTQPDHKEDVTATCIVAIEAWRQKCGT